MILLSGDPNITSRRTGRTGMGWGKHRTTQSIRSGRRRPHHVPVLNREVDIHLSFIQLVFTDHWRQCTLTHTVTHTFTPALTLRHTHRV